MESDEGYDWFFFVIVKVWKGLQGELLVQGDGDVFFVVVLVLILCFFFYGCFFILFFFGCFGIVFKFVEKDYVVKVGFLFFLSLLFFVVYCFIICLCIFFNGF